MAGLRRVEDGAKPQVFVCPGIYGDDKRLKQFRQFCAPLFAMPLLELPLPEAPAQVLGSIPLTGAFIAATIRERQPTGPIRLLGYSFGGNVAVEAARHLATEGRTVLLALVDAYLADHHTSPKLHRRTLARRLFWIALEAVSRRDWARRLSLAAVRRLRPHRHRALARRMLWSLRGRATQAWQPQPLAVPTLLAVSGPFAAGLAHWAAVLPHATVRRLPVDHWAILLPPAAAPLRDALVDHLSDGTVPTEPNPIRAVPSA